jgi:DNA-binding response OmpR family regulator
LVVEDDPAMNGAIAGLLADEGLDVMVATTLSGARVFLARSPTRVGVVVLDVSLADGDSDALLELLDEARGEVPSVILASASARVAKLAAAYGVPYLVKPFDLARLAATVHVALEHNLRPRRRSPRAAATLA